MRLLSYRQLIEEKGIRFSRTHLRRLMYDPAYAHVGFPKAVQVSAGRIGWYEHEIDDFLKNRPRREPTALFEEEQDLVLVD
jgi:predicted DNA-binding transcriptional regulator AlpA